MGNILSFHCVRGLPTTPTGELVAVPAEGLVAICEEFGLVKPPCYKYVSEDLGTLILTLKPQQSGMRKRVSFLLKSIFQRVRKVDWHVWHVRIVEVVLCYKTREGHTVVRFETSAKMDSLIKDVVGKGLVFTDDQGCEVKLLPKEE